MEGDRLAYGETACLPKVGDACMGDKSLSQLDGRKRPSQRDSRGEACHGIMTGLSTSGVFGGVMQCTALKVVRKSRVEGGSSFCRLHRGRAQRGMTAWGK